MPPKSRTKAGDGTHLLYPPPTYHPSPVSVTHHGITRQLPYRWLRDRRSDPAVVDLMREEGRHADSWFAHSGASNIASRLAEEINSSRMGGEGPILPQMRGSYYYMEREVGPAEEEDGNASSSRSSRSQAPAVVTQESPSREGSMDLTTGQPSRAASHLGTPRKLPIHPRITLPSLMRADNSRSASHESGGSIDSPSAEDGDEEEDEEAEDEDPATTTVYTRIRREVANTYGRRRMRRAKDAYRDSAAAQDYGCAVDFVEFCARSFAQDPRSEVVQLEEEEVVLDCGRAAASVGGFEEGEALAVAELCVSPDETRVAVCCNTDHGKEEHAVFVFEIGSEHKLLARSPASGPPCGAFVAWSDSNTVYYTGQEPTGRVHQLWRLDVPPARPSSTQDGGPKDGDADKSPKRRLSASGGGGSPLSPRKSDEGTAKLVLEEGDRNFAIEALRRTADDEWLLLTTASYTHNEVWALRCSEEVCGTQWRCVFKREAGLHYSVAHVASKPPPKPITPAHEVRSRGRRGSPSVVAGSTAPSAIEALPLSGDFIIWHNAGGKSPEFQVDRGVPSHLVGEYTYRPRGAHGGDAMDPNTGKESHPTTGFGATGIITANRKDELPAKVGGCRLTTAKLTPLIAHDPTCCVEDVDVMFGAVLFTVRRGGCRTLLVLNLTDKAVVAKIRAQSAGPLLGASIATAALTQPPHDGSGSQSPRQEAILQPGRIRNIEAPSAAVSSQPAVNQQLFAPSSPVRRGSPPGRTAAATTGKTGSPKHGAATQPTVSFALDPEVFPSLPPGAAGGLLDEPVDLFDQQQQRPFVWDMLNDVATLVVKATAAPTSARLKEVHTLAVIQNAYWDPSFVVTVENMVVPPAHYRVVPLSATAARHAAAAEHRAGSTSRNQSRRGSGSRRGSFSQPPGLLQGRRSKSNSPPNEEIPPPPTTIDTPRHPAAGTVGVTFESNEHEAHEQFYGAAFAPIGLGYRCRLVCHDSPWRYSAKPFEQHLIWVPVNPNPKPPSATSRASQPPSTELHHQQQHRLQHHADEQAIPVFVAYEARSFKPGQNPALVYCYGSYGVSTDPKFDESWVPILRRGVVCVIAGVRGGGEMGNAWRQAGNGTRRANSVTDLIRVCEFLGEKGWCDSKRIALSAESAGCTVVASAALCRKPSLFRAIRLRVPFVDVLNTMLDDRLPLTSEEWLEWGNPIEDVRVFRAMLDYSPTENVPVDDPSGSGGGAAHPPQHKKGRHAASGPVVFPNCFLESGLHDSRVGFDEAAMLVAVLRQQWGSSAAAGRALLHRCRMSGGHDGGGDDDAEAAESLAFVLLSLGIAR